MKKKTMACILVCLLALILTACRADDPVDTLEEALVPIDTEAETIKDAYPSGDAAYPIGEVFVPINESAYPITEADLAWLLRTWQLATYAEDGINLAPPMRTLTLNADGSYVMTTETEQETGFWTTIFLAVESNLILNQDNGETQYYQILDLGEAMLNLHTQRGTNQIDEGYVPVD